MSAYLHLMVGGGIAICQITDFSNFFFTVEKKKAVNMIPDQNIIKIFAVRKF